MGLWRFVISTGLKWRDSTEEVIGLLQSVTLADLQYPCTWPLLATIIQVNPETDIFPVRANYGGDEQATIGLNYLSSEIPLWLTLADCITSKLLNGKAPKVLRAITFEPGDPQSDLRPVTIAGNPDFRIDPYRDDFYRRIIDLRAGVKRRLKRADGPARDRLDSDQLTLKILANATSYGNFVELNVEDLAKPQGRSLCGFDGKPQTVSTSKSEEPGRYFHPLIATLITGGARLMLAITERLVAARGLDWAFCDTDSMAIARQPEIEEIQFRAKVETVQAWFEPLNPYSDKGSILKIEDTNFKVQNGALLPFIEPLYCFAISAKRYALFNLGPEGQIIIRKASAHGLGHLLAPYGEADAPASVPPPASPLAEIGVERWQYDLWHQIIRAALDGHSDQVDLTYHPALTLPAASRYGATTPKLLHWFAKHNQSRPYAEQVKPSNFLLAYQIAPDRVHECAELFEALTNNASDRPANFRRWPKPVAPYDRDASKAAEACFDRDMGLPIPAAVLKTYAEALAQYHLRPEHKFRRGDYTDRGVTLRRHVIPLTVRQIGKESNRWEERYFLGEEEGTEVDYGEVHSRAMDDSLRARIVATGQRKVARVSGVSRRTIERLLAGQSVRPDIQKRIIRALGNKR